MLNSKNKIVLDEDKNSYNAEVGNSVLINDSIESESINQNNNIIQPKNNELVTIDEDTFSQKLKLSDNNQPGNQI